MDEHTPINGPMSLCCSCGEPFCNIYIIHLPPEKICIKIKKSLKLPFNHFDIELKVEYVGTTKIIPIHTIILGYVKMCIKHNRKNGKVQLCVIHEDTTTTKLGDISEIDFNKVIYLDPKETIILK